MTTPFTALRNKKTKTEEFRKSAHEVARALAKEVAQHTVKKG
ncbi:MAG: hypothetical protein UW54_C0028G0013, partial [Parcubacteria group bacterium GW2011_GWC1_44_26]